MISSPRSRVAFGEWIRTLEYLDLIGYLHKIFYAYRVGFKSHRHKRNIPQTHNVLSSWNHFRNCPLFHLGRKMKATGVLCFPILSRSYFSLQSRESFTFSLSRRKSLNFGVSDVLLPSLYMYFYSIPFIIEPLVFLRGRKTINCLPCDNSGGVTGKKDIYK